ncbi:WUSCHEL-related homeobox 14-like [Gastrolobium bilobum]|uniref:WUSCHEL-related homeobox 14-like n=1 Tax=Gastrolobium bilobum TaxID=150636 RepID=UPI002AAFFE6B|nr:WUSCHEL-related homeobox 14-like [Gastrolobium bilobum]
MSNGMGFQEQHSNHNAATMMRGNVSMTQKQIETLMIQIAAYETLSEQVTEKYWAHRAAHQAPPQVTSEVVKPVNMYGGDTSKGIFNMKPRWTPTTEQLQIMEKIFKQNKRARSKKKQPNAVIANNVNTNGRLTSGDSRYQMK